MTDPDGMPPVPTSQPQTGRDRLRNQKYFALGTAAAVLVGYAALATVLASNTEEQSAAPVPSASEVAEDSPGLGVLPPTSPAESGPGQSGADMGTTAVALPAAVSDVASGIIFGDTDTATKKVVYWSDPSCPYCKSFDADYGAMLVSAGMGDTATVEWRVVAFLSEGSLRAANALMCASDQGRFHEYRTLMYQRQPDGGGEGYTNPGLIEFGELSGVPDMTEFATCVNSGRYNEYISRMTLEMQNAGVPGTPALFLDGTNVLESGMSFETFVTEVGLDVQDYLPEQEPGSQEQPAAIDP